MRDELSRPLLPHLGRLVGHMARSGWGTSECLAAGSLPLPVHFYSPVPDLGDLDARDVWRRRSDLAGVDLRSDEQLVLLRELGGAFADECAWPLSASGDEHAFHLDNPAFSFGCAASTHCMLRRLRPRRVIEVGSGFSSRVISAALLRNQSEGAGASDYTIVDPHPAASTRTLPGLTRLIEERVELRPPGDFDRLEAADVLFIDSGHTVRIGGDVNFLILDVLPRLAPGVVVHFHDIPLPYEYPRAYYANPSFRALWTEAYLLQAFLAFNAAYEVVLALAYLMTEQREAFHAAFPSRPDPRGLGVSGSFWIRRTPA
ncbi:MAG: class I SAM-dependent methyltransferase [Planctomycetes bacterium]|nr:class I SAM-dependent methyltransferase [Planctomycetota bacterium]